MQVPPHLKREDGGLDWQKWYYSQKTCWQRQSNHQAAEAEKARGQVEAQLGAKTEELEKMRTKLDSAQQELKEMNAFWGLKLGDARAKTTCRWQATVTPWRWSDQRHAR